MERDGGAGGKRSKKDKGVFSAGRGATVLTETEALEAINYRPRHPESKRAYEEILSLIQGNIGDQPQDILRGAADEVLAILKDEKLTDPRRQAEIERLIRRLTPDRFAKLVTLGKAIHDFHTVRTCVEGLGLGGRCALLCFVVVADAMHRSIHPTTTNDQ